MGLTDLVKTRNGKAILSESSGHCRQVFGKYLYEGELGILFGDNNAGKSILANDIAFFVCGGGHDWPDMKSPKIPTLYIDMEMSSEQFANRYRNAGDYMTDDYKRTEVNALCSSEDKLFPAIRSEIILQQSLPNPPKFIIIDNITNGFGSIFSAAKMRYLISDLKTLKERFGLTILLIAHCPKRKQNEPITDNNLGGSKMIGNFCDSAFAIAPSQLNESTKYIKQIKTRAGEKLHDVMTVKISTEPYLCMEYVNMIDEDAHINPKNSEIWYLNVTPEVEIEIVKLLNDGYSASQIANTLNLKADVIWDYIVSNNLQ